MTQGATVGVIGVGNVLAADDGAGILAVRRLSSLTEDDRVRCVECERGGLDLLEILVGFRHAIVVDASLTGNVPPGHVGRHVLRRPFAVPCSASLHTIGLDGILGFGLAVGMNVPDEVTVLTVEAGDMESFGRGCSPEVEEAVNVLVIEIANRVRTMVPDMKIARVVRIAPATGSEMSNPISVPGA